MAELKAGHGILTELFQYNENGRLAYCEVLDATQRACLADAFATAMTGLKLIVKPYRALWDAENEELEIGKETFSPSFAHTLKKLFSPAAAQKEIDAFEAAKKDKLAQKHKTVEEKQKEVDAAERALAAVVDDASALLEALFEIHTEQKKKEFEEYTQNWPTSPKFSIRRSEVVLGTGQDVLKLYDLCKGLFK